MKTIKLVVLLLIFGALSLVTCDHYSNIYKPTQLQQIIDNCIVTIETRGWIKDEVKEEITQALGIHLGDSLVLGLYHAVGTENVKKVRTPFGVFSKPRHIFSEKYFIRGEQVDVLGIEDDIILLQSKLKDKLSLSYGDSSELRLGDKILGIGWPLHKGITITEGIVSAINWLCLDDPGECFLISFKTTPGDSGGPVFAYSTSGLELIGITYAYSESKGIIYHISYVKEVIDRILNFEFNEYWR